jgi:hypothetical protein
MDPIDSICWNTSVPVFYGSIQDMWCVAGLIWTFLLLKHHHNRLVQAVTSQNACHFWDIFGIPMDPVDSICWNTSVSVFYGSMLDMWCVAGLIWAIIHPKTHQNGTSMSTQKAYKWTHAGHVICSWTDLGHKLPGTSMSTQKAQQIWYSFWHLPWIQLTVSICWNTSVSVFYA